jgi:hypothetical protein
MDRADYFEAKAAILDAQRVQLQADLAKSAAWATAYATLKRLGVDHASGYRWDDAALTIAPVTANGGQ